jgi:MOSC domain-containing protein YiiM
MGGDTTELMHVGMDELIKELDEIRRSPHAQGTVELVVRRPAVDEREVLDEAELDVREGLVGDSWRARGSRHTADGSADQALQLTLMNARVVAAIARERDRWPLAGDQVFVDFDLSIDNLPPGTRLGVGSAVVEVSDVPHTGCAKFSRRFGSDVLRFVNSPPGRALRLRGMNARIVESGRVRPGDAIRKL